MHHTRRKSGHGSMTDVRKAATGDTGSKSRPKHASSSKSSSSKYGHSSHSSHRDQRDQRDHHDQHKRRDYSDDDESFPQFCMYCEQQFVASDDRPLYCSDTCRDCDLGNSNAAASTVRHNSYSSSRAYYPPPEPPRDIIPRAMPSRPSTNYSQPAELAMASTAPNITTSSAMAALRSLSLRDASPPSPAAGSALAASGIWPFSSSSSSSSRQQQQQQQQQTTTTRPSYASSQRNVASPTNSYHSHAAATSSYAQAQNSQPHPYPLSSTYDAGYYRTGVPNYYSYQPPATEYAEYDADRPLPARRPDSYSRPKGVDLVSPLLGR